MIENPTQATVHSVLVSCVVEMERQAAEMVSIAAGSGGRLPEDRFVQRPLWGMTPENWTGLPVMNVELNIPPRWHEARPVFRVVADRPIMAGISGGRTSAMMAALLPHDAILCFENTGREHEKTYEFLNRLDAALDNRIVWLEYEKPAEYGAPPIQSGFRIVSYETANRTGQPFEQFMETLAEFRRVHKGLEPVAPWARGRLCSAYMKQRVQAAYAKSLGLRQHAFAAGLRADEPARVNRFIAAGTKNIPQFCPLATAGIVKADVLEFWAQQAFDLEIPPEEGNCTLCFLKDEADLARVAQTPGADLPWWEAMQAKYPGFGGHEKPSYQQLAGEGRVRMEIEAALRDRTAMPECPPFMDPRRFRLVFLQERRRLAGQRKAFACECEGSATLAGMDDDGERNYLLAL